MPRWLQPQITRSKMTPRQDDLALHPSIDSIVSSLTETWQIWPCDHRLLGRLVGTPVHASAVQTKVRTYLPACCLHPLLLYESLSVQLGQDQVALVEEVPLFHLQMRDKQTPLD